MAETLISELQQIARKIADSCRRTRLLIQDNNRRLERMQQRGPHPAAEHRGAADR